MTTLHQVLAVEGTRKGNAFQRMEEAKVTFTKKEGLFLGQVKRYEHFDDAEAEKESLPDEVKALDSTVHDKLAFVFEHVAEWFDVVYQKEATNQVAVADIVLSDGTVLAEKVPATYLLGLETKLKQVREVVKTIPNLAPGIEWELDEQQGPHVYKAKHPKVSFKTKQTLEWQEIAPATEHHPAQVKTWDRPSNVGRYTTDMWSGMISTADKAAMIRRLDMLDEAVRNARQKANETEVKKDKIGRNLTNYLLDGEVPA